MTDAHTLAVLQQLHQLHEQLAAAAHRLDWLAVERLWQDCLPLLADLKRHPAAALADRHRLQAVALLEGLVATENRVIDRGLGWMDHVKPLLEVFGTPPRRTP